MIRTSRLIPFVVLSAALAGPIAACDFDKADLPNDKAEAQDPPAQSQPDPNQPDPNQPDPNQPDPNQPDPNQPESCFEDFHCPGSELCLDKVCTLCDANNPLCLDPPPPLIWQGECQSDADCEPGYFDGTHQFEFACYDDQGCQQTIECGSDDPQCDGHLRYVCLDVIRSFEAWEDYLCTFRVGAGLYPDVDTCVKATAHIERESASCWCDVAAKHPENEVPLRCMDKALLNIVRGGTIEEVCDPIGDETLEVQETCAALLEELLADCGSVSAQTQTEFEAQCGG